MLINLHLLLRRSLVAQRKTASQKAMELKERDVHVLIRSMQRWGDIHQRYDIVSVEFKFAVVLSSILTMMQVTESKLQNMNQGMLQTEICSPAMKDSEDQKRQGNPN